MDTSLCFDSARRRLRICAKETFSSDDHIALHVAAELDTRDGLVSARARLRKRYFPKSLLHVDVGAAYSTDADEIRYGFATRKRWELSEDGLLSLDFKAHLDFSQMHKRVSFSKRGNRDVMERESEELDLFMHVKKRKIERYREIFVPTLTKNLDSSHRTSTDDAHDNDQRKQNKRFFYGT